MKKRFWLLFCYCQVTAVLAADLQYNSDVPLLQQAHLSASFWQQQLADANNVLLTPAQIALRNSQTFALQAEMQPLSELPAQYSAAQLLARISKVSSVPAATRYDANGQKVAAEKWQRYQALLATERVAEQNPIRFGLVVRRTLLLAFPTLDRVFKQPDDVDLSRFQETGLFPGQAVAVLHQSADKQWLLVQSFNYTGWIQAADLALGERETVLAYTTQEPFLVVTGAKIQTAYTPQMTDISELQLDMGVRLPLLDAAQYGHNINGQNPASSYIVQLPRRLADGSLTFSAALIGRNQDVHTGYLPFTAANIVQQAFKFLGERYGWGHDYNGRDCTGFVSEVYSSFGFKMPRNSTEQGKGRYGTNQTFATNTSVADKQSVIMRAKAGDLFYLPGHVAMYLGEVQGQPFIIHDVHGLAYQQNSAELYQGILNGVFVTPLLPLKVSADKTYLDVIYNAKSLR